ncbi:hypothetical protein TI39_contig321g00033 [Zymoseptoria brevis]|uniref:Uncharacterized protein n=1 Tax=Zymoseptoria brevis TaxID=1047168 RepID=A0A0F4GTT2_9PEZI|nr:hypothetical protein TI39_contig321g00033 [Zymoseptoria brevis]
MAAAKVFAVPELLENILLQCADMAVIAQLKRPEGRLLYGDCNPSYHRTYGRLLPGLGAATWLVETQGGCTNYVSSGLDFDFDMWDHPSGARDIRTKGHDAPGASWRRIKFSRGANSNSKPVLCASYFEGQDLSGEYDVLAHHDTVMIYPGVTLGTFQAWMESSTKNMGRNVADLYSETDPTTVSSGRRGTLKDPQVLREAPTDDSPGAQDSVESGV